MGDVCVGEEEVLCGNDEQLSVGEEGGEPAGHGCAGKEDKARAGAARDNGCQCGSLLVGDRVVDVVDKNGIVLLGILDGYCPSNVDSGGIDLEHVKTLEHAVCKLGLAKAERGADKCQPRASPLWLQALVKFEGNLD